MAEMKPKVAKRITTSQPHPTPPPPPPPPPTPRPPPPPPRQPQLHSITFPQTS